MPSTTTGKTPAGEPVDGLQRGTQAASDFDRRHPAQAHPSRGRPVPNHPGTKRGSDRDRAVSRAVRLYVSRGGRGHAPAPAPATSERTRRPRFTPPPFSLFSLAFTPSPPLLSPPTPPPRLFPRPFLPFAVQPEIRAAADRVASHGVPGATSLRLRPLRPLPRPRPLLLRPDAPPRGELPSICARSVPCVLCALLAY